MTVKIDDLTEEEKKELINATLRVVDFVEFTCSKCGTFVKDAKVASMRRRQDFRTVCTECKKNEYFSDKEKREKRLEKIKKTKLEKYGYENPFFSKEWQEQTRSKRLEEDSYKKAFEKAKRTNLEKYGIELATNTPEAKEKRRNTMIEKYGVEHPLQNNDFLNKMKRTMFSATYESMKEKLEDSISIISEEFSGTKNVRYKFKCNICGKNFNSAIDSGRTPKCPKCNKIYYDKETEVYDFLSSHIYCEHNRRFTVDGKRLELDIYIPERNLGIEFNGLYWHSSNKIGKNYHLKKQEFFSKLGIDVIFIFEDEWIENRKIVESILLSRIRKFDTILYARKLTLREVPKKEEKDFFNNNHLQGFVGSSYCCGLYNGDELVSCMSFGKSRFNKKYEWELLRYATIINSSVVGGAKRIFKRFITDNSPRSLISYCDKRYFTGYVYTSLGMNLINESAPNYFYTKRYKRYSRVKFQKHKLSKLLEVFDEEKTEVENVLNNGYDIIHDCGNKVYSIFYKKD